MIQSRKKQLARFLHHWNTPEGKKVIELVLEILIQKLISFCSQVVLLIFGLRGIREVAEIAAIHLSSLGVSTTQIWVMQDLVMSGFIFLFISLAVGSGVMAIIKQRNGYLDVFKSCWRFAVPFLIVGLFVSIFSNINEENYRMAIIFLLLAFSETFFSGRENRLLKKVGNQLFKQTLNNGVQEPIELTKSKALETYDADFVVEENWAPYFTLLRERVEPQRNLYHIELTRTYQFVYLPLKFERKICLNFEDDSAIATTYFIKFSE